MLNNNEIKSKFGALLKKLRNEQKLSQEGLAEKASLDRTYISLLERGLRTPTIATIFAIANGLSKKPSEIIKMLE